MCKKDEHAEETYHQHFQEEFFPVQEKPKSQKSEILIKLEIWKFVVSLIVLF